ncbi:MAG: ArsR/SmtB family transcription factor [Thermoleophilia bacterium]
MDADELAGVVTALAARVAALEERSAPGRAAGTDDLALVRSLMDEVLGGGGGAPEDGALLYAGAGQGPDGVVAWQMNRRWTELAAAEPAPVAAVLAALGSPQRVQVLQVLLRGPATTSEIGERLGGPSSGGLFHHLKELMAAGLVHQPRRGAYAVRPQHMVPILAVLAAAIDLGGPQGPEGG